MCNCAVIPWLHSQTSVPIVSLLNRGLQGLLHQLIVIFSLVILVGLVMLVHELGHLAAAKVCNVPASEVGLGMGPKLFGFRLGSISFNLRAFPVASFVRLDGAALAERSVQQQLFVHLAGIIFNLVAGFAAYGTIFSWINLALAAINVLPLYKHDGWKCGVVIMRTLLRRTSKPVEWVFTFSGGLASLVIVDALAHLLRLK